LLTARFARWGGILVEPLPDERELMTRETADPFPGDRGFARPPAGIR